MSSPGSISNPRRPPPGGTRVAAGVLPGDAGEGASGTPALMQDKLHTDPARLGSQKGTQRETDRHTWRDRKTGTEERGIGRHREAQSERQTVSRGEGREDGVVRGARAVRGILAMLGGMNVTERHKPLEFGEDTGPASTALGDGGPGRGI